MSEAKAWIAGVADQAAGLAKRAIGELTARPDFVLAGEKQQAKGRAELVAAERAGEKRAAHRVIGWKLDPVQRAELLAAFPPRYAETVADHVTLAAGVPQDAPLPLDCSAQIVGQVDDGEGVQALAVSINGTTARPDGGTFHITWSLAPGRRAEESNDVLASLGWERLAEPRLLELRPASI